MATKHGLAVAGTFVRGNEGATIDAIKKKYDKDKLASVASSLGWLVRSTLGSDTFRTCLNLVESSPSCGGGMEALEKAFKLGRLGPYKDGPLNAAKLSSKDFVSHMANYGLDPYGEPLAGGGGDEEETAAAAAALASTSQRLMKTQARSETGDSQRDSLLFTMMDEELPGLSLFDPDKTSIIPAGQGVGDAGGDGDGEGNDADRGANAAGKVSVPVSNDDHERVGDVDDPAQAGNVRAPAATDPLLAAGDTVGRIGAAQSQAQAGSQVPGSGSGSAEPKRPKKRAVCPTVRRGDACMDKTCVKAHPARCGNPNCFPIWRKDCQLWHVKAPPPSSQGNGRGAVPGRAGRTQAQGKKEQQQLQQQQQGQGRQQQRLVNQQRRHPRSQWQQQQQQGRGKEWHPRLPSPPAPPPPPLFQPPPPPRPAHWQGWPQLQQRVPHRGWQEAYPSYRDVVVGGNRSSTVIEQLSPAQVQERLLGRLAALEERLAGLAGLCQLSPGMSRI